MKEAVLQFVDKFHLFPLFNRYTKDTATVFMMHKIDPHDAGSASSMFPARLVEYFNYLKNHQYNVLSLSDYVNALRQRKKTYKTVVFTVDDGYRDFYLHAFPIFRRYGYPATIFLATDFIDNKTFMWWDAVEYIIKSAGEKAIDLDFLGLGKFRIGSMEEKEQVISLAASRMKHVDSGKIGGYIAAMAGRMGVNVENQPIGAYEPLKWDEILEMRTGGIEFYPHTKTHPILSRVSRSQKRVELADSRSRIEEKLGIVAEIFCYPNGGKDDFDEETIEILKENGYVAAVTGIPGFDKTDSPKDMYRLRRFHLPSHATWFKQYISGLEFFKRKFIFSID